MNTFKDVLPTFKSFVLPIEEKTPQIHELHDAIIDTIHTFLFYFCEYEKVDKLSPEQFRLFNVEDSVRKTQSMFVGGSNHVFIPKLKKGKLYDVVEDYHCEKCRNFHLISWKLGENYGISHRVLSCFTSCVHYCSKIYFK